MKCLVEALVVVDQERTDQEISIHLSRKRSLRDRKTSIFSNYRN